MNKNSLLYILLGGFMLLSVPSGAQETPGEVVTESRGKRAWEIGVGASVFQFSRVDFTKFQKGSDNYQLGLQLRHSVIGPNLYIARELNPYFYLDLQGTVGFTEQFIDGADKLRTLYMVGPGLQWRLGEYFDSKYIDPFFRIGVSYMKKNFDMKYQGVNGDVTEEMSWVLENLYNKDGVDRNEMIPVSLGLGMNTWLNDHFGIGLQGDYLLMPYKDVANSLQGTVRLIWRMGGKSKKRIAPVQYIEVEKIVQGPKEVVEKIVEVPVSEPASVEICELFNNVYFEFDKSDIRPESEEVLDKIADIMKANSDQKYLITGYTDARGSAEYNIGLSGRRAAAVVEALQKRGVNGDIIKSRGVGKKISYAPVGESHIVREGDRKVTVEIITNMDYWNFMPKRDY
ncbi:OmpA family protein [Proteiniphilum sp.]|uniref:OmpA family protein n=1 Tax=Proteiniphilum sp. TaxID=1926877 RepID=UPI002B206D2F|nr:OmpA family protein [Proteiniphilum sp.]MEA4916810.1 OmpA family protein [Proteiniphilum sp.]